MIAVSIYALDKNFFIFAYFMYKREHYTLSFLWYGEFATISAKYNMLIVFDIAHNAQMFFNSVYM